MRVTREGRTLHFSEIGPHPEGCSTLPELTVRLSYGEEVESRATAGLTLDGVILPAIVAALEAAGVRALLPQCEEEGCPFCGWVDDRDPDERSGDEVSCINCGEPKEELACADTA